MGTCAIRKEAFFSWSKRKKGKGKKKKKVKGNFSDIFEDMGYLNGP